MYSIKLEISGNKSKYINRLYLLMSSVSKRGLSSYVRKYKEIPSIPFYKFVPIFTTKKTKSNVDLAFERLFDHYGPLFRVSAPFEPDRLFIRKPEHYREALAAEGKWPVNTNFDFLVSYRGRLRRDLFPDSGGLIGSHGEEWFKIRSEVGLQISVLM